MMSKNISKKVRKKGLTFGWFYGIISIAREGRSPTYLDSYILGGSAL
jgi:hypothetical protein